ncbi:MAG: histidine kinase dimerization/phospho-acceptor domain-containing protein [Rhodospirillaceae bacterium]
MPILPILWVLRAVKRRRNRRYDKLNSEILALRSEVKGLRRINGELLKLKENAEINDHRKTQFLARITHELRTPLTAVVGLADMVQQEPYGELGNPKYAEYIAEIRRTSSHMLDVFNDLLDLAKIESGQLEMNEAWMTLPMLLDDCRCWV